MEDILLQESSNSVYSTKYNVAVRIYISRCFELPILYISEADSVLFTALHLLNSFTSKSLFKPSIYVKLRNQNKSSKPLGLNRNSVLIFKCVKTSQTTLN